MLDRALLHTDGGSRGNPGPSGIGFVILVDDGRELLTICEGGAYIGKATNNQAEYQAMLWGLQNAVHLGVKHLDIRADSELLIKQVKGEYKVRNEGIKPLYEQVKKTIKLLGSYTIGHVYRNDNARADALANEAMDSKTSVGTFGVPCGAAAGEQAQGHPQVMGSSARTPQISSGLARSSQMTDISAHNLCAESRLATSSQTASKQAKNSHTASKQAKNSQAKTPQTLSLPLEETSKGTIMDSGIYTLSVKDHFDAAHALVGYPGECRNLHGHTWDIEVIVSGTKLDDIGILYDFKNLKADLAAILGNYDHVFLNDVPPFDTINATAENLARVIYEQLEASLPAHIALDEVAVWESPIAKLTYRKK